MSRSFRRSAKPAGNVAPERRHGTPDAAGRCAAMIGAQKPPSPSSGSR
ncbi:hypothetical protein [Azospirillum doebereinerae]